MSRILLTWKCRYIIQLQFPFFLDFVSVDRFKGRIWQLVSRYIKSHGSSDNPMVSCESARHQFNHDQQLKDSRNQALLDVRDRHWNISYK